MFRKLFKKLFYKPTQEEVDRERCLIEEERELIRRVAKALRLPNREYLLEPDATPLLKEDSE